MHRALFIGRFQPFHNAHLEDIKKILREADEVIIAVGSSNETNTLENPFSYSERKQMISKALKGSKIKNFRIYPVPDLYNDRKWVAYAKARLPKFNAVYSGNEWTLRCFKKFDFKIRKIKLIEGINSTIIRGMMAKGKNWQALVPKETAGYIQKIEGDKRINRIYSK